MTNYWPSLALVVLLAANAFVSFKLFYSTFTLLLSFFIESFLGSDIELFTIECTYTSY